MQPAQLIAHSQTRLVASDRAARVLAVAEEGLAQAALRGLIRRDEIVEVLVHDRESLPTRRSLEREERPGRKVTPEAPCGKAPRYPDARASTRVGSAARLDMPRTGEIHGVALPPAGIATCLEQCKRDVRSGVS